ncbi:fumarate hydratase, partial [Escherichia coli]|nr:fumarate hydratase [Escherichia coli]
GIVTCFVNIGMGVQWDSTDMTVQQMVDEGVRQAYTNPDNPLRASVLMDPAGKRINTKDNTPAVVHINMVPGDKIEIQIAAKGGGSENKTKMVMLNPSDDIAEWVEKTLRTMGAG